MDSEMQQVIERDTKSMTNELAIERIAQITKEWKLGISQYEIGLDMHALSMAIKALEQNKDET